MSTPCLLRVFLNRCTGVNRPVDLSSTILLLLSGHYPSGKKSDSKIVTSDGSHLLLVGTLRRRTFGEQNLSSSELDLVSGPKIKDEMVIEGPIGSHSMMVRLGSSGNLTP